MNSDRGVLFGIELETGVDQVGEALRHARMCDEAGLDIVSLTDQGASAGSPSRSVATMMAAGSEAERRNRLTDNDMTKRCLLAHRRGNGAMSLRI